MSSEKSDKKNYKDSLNLPKTDFPIRPNQKEDAEKVLKRWEEEDLYGKAFVHNKGKTKFILHDGPPYANGHIHLGSSYNKILKDFISKSQRMQGKHVPVTPGWDCHGLPIELKVTKEKGDLLRVELQKACREYAAGWIDIQRKEFKSLGAVMNWAHPYLTMNPGYEAKTLRAFGRFVEDGFIERKNKTVPWCASCQTVLASAEIEYKERKDPSIYVPFILQTESVANIFPDLEGSDVSVLIWTTTPWTLPLNRAVLAKPNTKYVVLNIKDQYVAVGAALAEKLCEQFGVQKDVVAEFDSAQLEGAKAVHPFIDGQETPIFLDGSVLVDDGTAFVHSAPGCGPEDYEVGIKNNLEIFSPLSPDGKYTEDILPKDLSGMPVSDGQIWVIKKLAEKGKLLHKASLRHPYPHCWRCRNGLIFRATKQWFFDLSKHDVRKKALAEIDKIDMKPETSRRRLGSTIEGRLEWCLSRQRVWGVPIPALLTKDDDEVYTSKEMIDFVADGVAKEGIEYWDYVSIEDLKSKIPNLPADKEFKKELDILDVWFDSGVSHYAVLKDNEDLADPADVYIEGKDQHRGWFQSSLLTSVALKEKSCSKAIYTHGYTVDEKGQKMSKSLGNVVAPAEVIEKIGADGLRLWASSIDLKDDPIMSDILVQNVKEVFRKTRNTCRFLLSNLYDFDFEKDALKPEQFLYVDKYALQQLSEFSTQIKSSYNDADFTGVFHKLGDYVSGDLSSFYLDIIKDRLYCDKPDSRSRRAAQTVSYYILDTLTKLVAPILSFTAELVSDHYQKDKTESIHLQNFNNIERVWEEVAQSMFGSLMEDGLRARKNMPMEGINVAPVENWNNFWQMIEKVRSASMKAIELEREKGIIKHPLEVSISLSFDNSDKELSAVKKTLDNLESLTGQTGEQFIKELLVVSKVSILDNASKLGSTELAGLNALVERAPGTKCLRCWKYEEVDGDLCQRCTYAIK